MSLKDDNGTNKLTISSMSNILMYCMVFVFFYVVLDSMREREYELYKLQSQTNKVVK